MFKFIQIPEFDNFDEIQSAKIVNNKVDTFSPNDVKYKKRSTVFNVI